MDEQPKKPDADKQSQPPSTDKPTERIKAVSAFILAIAALVTSVLSLFQTVANTANVEKAQAKAEKAIVASDGAEGSAKQAVAAKVAVQLAKIEVNKAREEVENTAKAFQVTAAKSTTFGSPTFYEEVYGAKERDMYIAYGPSPDEKMLTKGADAEFNKHVITDFGQLKLKVNSNRFKNTPMQMLPKLTTTIRVPSVLILTANGTIAQEKQNLSPINLVFEDGKGVQLGTAVQNFSRSAVGASHIPWTFISIVELDEGYIKNLPLGVNDNFTANLVMRREITGSEAKVAWIFTNLTFQMLVMPKIEKLDGRLTQNP